MDDAIAKITNQLIWPVPATPDPLTGRPFSYEPVLNPKTGQYSPHLGTDIKGKEGVDEILAALGGTVAWKATSNNSGNYIYIDTKLESGVYIQTRYRHMFDEAIPEIGDHVEAGELIGYVGNTGNSDGPHLHFEIWISTDGKPVSSKAKNDNYHNYNGIPIDPARVYPNNKVRADEWTKEGKRK